MRAILAVADSVQAMVVFSLHVVEIGISSLWCYHFYWNENVKDYRLSMRKSVCCYTDLARNISIPYCLARMFAK